MISSEQEDLYQISLLIDQLKHDDSQIRINATKNVNKIAKALGPERTRTELIPFLSESVDDEDEVLIAIAEALGELANYVGGPKHLHTLLVPLELLSMVEDNSVRETAIKSIESVVSGMYDEDLLEYYVPFVLKLASKDWFTSRMAAVALFHVVYKRLPESKKSDFRKMYFKLCDDETPMVRRAAAQYMGKLAAVMTAQSIQDELLSHFTKLSTDDQDSVRINIIPVCVVLGGVLPLEVKMSQVLPVILSLGGDKSWRVRWCFAGQFCELCKCMGSQVTNDSLCSILENLLKDHEAEVRSVAAANVASIGALLRKENVLHRILPIASQLVTDPSEHVRASLASVVNHLSPIVGQDSTIEHVLPFLLQLLRDENSEVRLNIISNLDIINGVIGVELLSQSLFPAIMDLAEDTKWRVRLAIIEHIPKLAEQLGSSFFNEKLNAMCMTWLTDDVYSIRRAAANNLSRLASLFGEEWTFEHILPKIEKMHSHTSYLHRMTALYGIEILTQSLTQKTVENTIVPILLQMVNDNVPNVRFTVARAINGILKSSGHDFEKKYLVNAISPALKTLSSDADRDVRFYASKALQELNEFDMDM